MESVGHYQTWCQEMGFSRRLKKTTAERAEELQATSLGRAESDLNFCRAQPKIKDQLELVFGNGVTRNKISEPYAKTLFDAIARITFLEEPSRAAAKIALRRLYQTCLDKKAKFLVSNRPTIPDGHFRSCTYGEALASVASFSDSWIRQPEDWTFKTHNKQRQFQSLISHLFEQHPPPKFFLKTWFRDDFLFGRKCQSAYVHVAAGHSIRTADLPIAYSRRMSHHFQQASERLTFPQALRWGQVRGLGGSQELANIVIVTPLAEEFLHDQFYQSVIKWFIDHPMFDVQQFPIVYDFLCYQKFGHGLLPRIVVGPDGREQLSKLTAPQPRLTMKGRTPLSLLREVDRWHRRLHQIDPSSIVQHWPHSGVREFQQRQAIFVDNQNSKKDKNPESEIVWTIRQLLSAGEVIEEGAQMKHCVASYVSSCRKRRTSIWSLQREKAGTKKRALTIEVRLPELRIAQIRGKSNRPAKSNEMKIIRQWAQLAGLKLDRFI